MYTGTLAATSNRVDWRFSVELVDPDTNDFVDLTGSTITIALRPQNQPNSILSGTNGDGHITVTGLGLFDVAFTVAEMSSLCAGNYDCGIVARLASGVPYQLLAGVLPVVDGVVGYP